jgi:hypothetical protein
LAIEVSILSAIIDELLTKLLDIPFDTYTTILQTISSCTGPQVAAIIYREIQKHISPIEKGITALRALTIYPMTDGSQSWPILKWKEGDADVLVLFDVDEENSGLCSWLMCKSGGKGHLSGLSLAWCVIDITTLKSLFQAAQHLLGILKMPKNDVLKLYGPSNKGNCSREEYTNLSNGI